MGNPVVHFEIAGPDGPALRQFYSDLFGWNIEVQGEEIGNYSLVSANEGGIGGGVYPTTEDMPARSYVTFYVQVDDLQTALDKVAGMGGNAIMPPMEIAPGMGSIAMFVDPADNTIGLYSLPPEWDGQMPPKGNAPPVVHFELGGSNAASLADFYTGMFDWQIDHHEEANYRFIQQESGGIGGGIFQHTEGMPPNHCELFDGRFRYREFAVGWLAPTKPTSCSHIALFGEQRGYSDNSGGGEVLHPEG